MLTQANFIALEGNIRKTWDSFFHDKHDYIKDLYGMINEQDSQVTDFTYGARGRMTPWAGAVSYSDIVKGHEKTYRPGKYSDGVKVEREVWEDKSFRSLKAKVNAMAQGVDDELAYESAEIFNNAFSTAILGPDSKPLCSSTHTLVPGGDSKINANTLTLDYTGIETTKLAMRNLTNDKGLQMRIPMNLIIAGSYWEDTLMQMFGSEKQAYVADNQINAYKNMKYYIHPLIDDKVWFGANEGLMKGGAGLNFWMRRDPRNIERDFTNNGSDFNTEVLSWKSVGRWDKGWTNFFWCYGNNPS